MESSHLERLSAADCHRLLSGAPVGRLVVPTPHFPAVDLVPFAVVEGELVVAVRAGSAGDAMAAGTVAAFEAGAADHEHRGQGWSVVVKGPVEDLDNDVAELVRPLLSPWQVSPDDRLLLVRAARVTGQRIVADAGPTPATPAAAAEPASPRLAPPSAVARQGLTADAALSRLRSAPERVGRLALCPAGDPQVFPLNYAVDGDAIVFRTQVGTALTGITRSLATFEVDHIDASGAGWAVTFEGLAQEVIDADPAALRARIDALALDTWPGGERSHVVRITPYSVRGTEWSLAGVAPTPRSFTDEL